MNACSNDKFTLLSKESWEMWGKVGYYKLARNDPNEKSTQR
jgi:hypothetical protein